VHDCTRRNIGANTKEKRVIRRETSLLYKIFKEEKIMENATKGLMIAGAILIAIVLIGIGVMLVGQAQGWIGNSQGQMDAMSIRSFNEKFEAREGTIKGTDVKTLLTDISQNNQQAINNSTQDQTGIKVQYDNDPIIDGQDTTTANNSPNAIIGIRAGIIIGRSYTVTMTYKTQGPGSGLIDTITIKPM